MADGGIVSPWHPDRDVETFLREQMAFLSSALRGCPCPDCTDLFVKFINAMWKHRRHA